MRYRKKPVVVEAPVLIEAVQLRWDTWSEMCEHAGVGRLADGKPEGCYLGPDGQPRESHESWDRMGLLIPTPDGLMIAARDDWVIKGVTGESLSAVKPDIFALTYEPA